METVPKDTCKATIVLLKKLLILSDTDVVLELTNKRHHLLLLKNVFLISATEVVFELKSKGDHKGEMETYEEARRVLEATGTLESNDGATVLTNLASAMVKCERVVDALVVYEDLCRPRSRCEKAWVSHMGGL